MRLLMAVFCFLKVNLNDRTHLEGVSVGAFVLIYE